VINSLKVVTPVKTGVQNDFNWLILLDSPSAVSPSVMSLRVE